MDSYKIELEPYCECCPEFDVDVDENSECYASGPPNLFFESQRVVVKYYRTITCSHIERCRAMMMRLKEKEHNEQERD